MAKLGFRYVETGINLYIVLINNANQHRKSSGIFETDIAANWDEYDLSLAEIDDYFYELTLPNMENGSFSAEVFYKEGADPAVTDARVGQRFFEIVNNEFYSISQSQLVLLENSLDSLQRQIAELTRALVRFNM